jgi:hypothetical protein
MKNVCSYYILLARDSITMAQRDKDQHPGMECKGGQYAFILSRVVLNRISTFHASSTK